MSRKGTMPGYVYRGTNHDTAPKPNTTARQRARTVPDCGTTAGYYAHRRFNEEQCQACRDALSAASKKRRAAEKASA